MNQAPPLDLVTVAIAVATGLFGAGTAQYVGPYAVIFIGAVLGAGWAASRRQTGTRSGTVIFVAGLVLLSLLVTVPIAEAVARYVQQDSRWMLGPVAAVVAGIGEKWPDVLAWAIGLFRRAAEAWLSRRSQTPPGGDTQ